MIKLAKNLSLPTDVVTETIGIVAKRRMGKSYTGRKLLEELFRERLQTVIIDPKGDWWGLRSSADGKSPGLPIVIIGGDRGDVPLEPGAGEMVAKLVVEDCVSALLDLSSLRKHQVATFMTGFLETLYRLKNHEKYRTPLMLIIDEADAIAPQRPGHGEERMLGAIEDVVRRGGQRGIGCTLITQRSAVLNKNVLTQVQVMIALRTIAPQDLAAMNAWIDVHGTADQRKTLMESLPSLAKGEAWVWSPGWPTEDGIFKNVHVSPIWTFDSGATPKPGEKRKEPKTLADVDVEALTRQMAATIERAKADDPKALRAEVASLKADIERAQTAQLEIMIPTFELKNINACREDVDRLIDFISKLEESSHAAREHLRHVVTDLARHAYALGANNSVQAEGGTLAKKSHATLQPGVTVRPVAVRASPERDGNGVPGFRKGAREMLAQLARMGALTRQQLATLSGMSPGSGTFSTYIGELKRAGYIVEDGGREWVITEAGRAYIGPVDPAPATPDELVQMWSSRFRAGGRQMLRLLVDHYPKPLTRQQIAEGIGMAPGSGTFSTYLGELRRNGLIENAGGGIAASSSLFLGVRA